MHPPLADVARRELLLLAAAAVIPAALFPLIQSPVLALAAVGGAAAAALAWRSLAYPLALASLPSPVFALVGSNPLPKGAVTGMAFAWIVSGVVVALARDPGGPRGLLPELRLPILPVLLLLVLAGVMIARLNGSPAASYGQQKVELFFAGAVPALIAAMILARTREGFDLFVGLTLFVAVFTAGALFLQLAGGQATAVFSGRYSLSSSENPIELGRQTGIGLLVALYLVMGSPTVWVRLAALGSVPVLAVGLIASGSRGPVVGVTLAIVAFFVFAATDPATRRRIPLIVVGAIAALVLVAQLVPGQAAHRALSVLSGTGAGVSSNGRSELWSQAVSVFNAHPFTGAGTGGFAPVNPVELYPHNLLLEVAAELGLLGLVPLVGALGSGAAVLLGGWRRAMGRDRLRASLVIALFVSALANAMFSGDISTNSDVWLAIGLGVGLAPRAIRAEQTKRARDDTSFGGQPVVPGLVGT